MILKFEREVKILMNQSSKISCYKKFYGQLKTDPSISGLGYPDEKSNFDLFCSIGDTKVNYSLRDKIDLLSIKAEKHYPGLTDDQLQNLGKNLVDGTNYSVTHYDGKLILQSNLTFVGVADHEAEKQVHDFAERFFEFLKSKVSEMDVPTAEKTIENNFAKNEPVGEKVSEFNGEEAVETIVLADPKSEVIESAEKDKNKEIYVDDTLEKSDLMEINKPLLVDPDLFSPEDKNDAIGGNTSDLLSDAVKSKKTITEVQKVTDNLQVSPQGYVRAPEVVEQMRQMYSEMNETFDSRNEQLDYREATLKEKEVLLNSISHDSEKLKKEADEVQSQNEIEKQKLKVQWEKLNGKEQIQKKEVEALNARESVLNKKELELISREQSLTDKSKNVKAKEEINRAKSSELKARAADLDIIRAKQDTEAIKFADKEKRLNAKSDELDLKFQKCEIQEKQLKIQKDTLDSKRKDVEARAKYVESLGTEKNAADTSDILRKLENAENRVIQSEAMLQEMGKKNSELKKEVNALKDNEKEFIHEIDKLKSNAKVDMPDQQKVDDYRKVIAFENEKKVVDERHINELQEKSTLIGQLTAQINSLEEELKEVNESKQPEYNTLSLKEQLNNAQIGVSIIPGEGDPKLTGEKDGCIICINESVHMIYAEKAVKRSLKYQKQVDEWNQEDICTSYILSDKKIICKRMFNDRDIVADVQSIIRRLRDLG